MSLVIKRSKILGSCTPFLSGLVIFCSSLFSAPPLSQMGRDFLGISDSCVCGCVGSWEEEGGGGGWDQQRITLSGGEGAHAIT